MPVTIKQQDIFSIKLYAECKFKKTAVTDWKCSIWYNSFILFLYCEIQALSLLIFYLLLFRFDRWVKKLKIKMNAKVWILMLPELSDYNVPVI